MTETKTPLAAQWRLMQPADLHDVHDISCIVHPDFPEDLAIFADRLAVFPQGCFVLQGDTQLLGYSFSHPWARLSAPALNSLLGALPQQADSYYLHDIALLPQTRSMGAAGKLVALLVETAQAHHLDSLSLVAVNGSRPYWERQGFAVVDVPHLRDKLRSYSEDACFMMREL